MLSKLSISGLCVVFGCPEQSRLSITVRSGSSASSLENVSNRMVMYKAREQSNIHSAHQQQHTTTPVPAQQAQLILIASTRRHSSLLSQDGKKAV
eukprot:6197555-Pleurochrysis_carterae.AAC.5